MRHYDDEKGKRATLLAKTTFVYLDKSVLFTQAFFDMGELI